MDTEQSSLHPVCCLRSEGLLTEPAPLPHGSHPSHPSLSCRKDAEHRNHLSQAEATAQLKHPGFHCFTSLKPQQFSGRFLALSSLHIYVGTTGKAASVQGPGIWLFNVHTPVHGHIRFSLFFGFLSSKDFSPPRF